MNKLFNKIRKTALDENRIGKYLSYAIGEIILVVIGILIAIQINTYNQNLANIQRINTYIESLDDEIQHNIKSIQSTVDDLRLDLKANAKTLTHLNSKEAETFSEEKIKSVFDTGPIYQVLWAKSTLDDLINSGTLAYLKDEKLKNGILKLEAHKSVEQHSFENAEEVWINNHKPYLMRHNSVANNWKSINGIELPKLPFKLDRNAFVNNRDYSNIVSVRMRMVGNYEATLLGIRDTLIKLSGDINNHLNK
mgnify:CR=1 FL=1